ncbi:MAG: AAA family ATPase, partial [Proteobacteria bacterium]|nr:AAA family ATPase [Pseudomonadota bacterium]
ELKHFIERIYVVYNDKEIITEKDLFNELTCFSINEDELEDKISPFRISEYEIIKSTLAKTNNDILKASEILRISRSTLYRKIKKYNLIS